MSESTGNPKSISSRFFRFLLNSFKFRLSTLLWLTLAVGIFLVWQKDRQQLEERIARLEQQNFGGYSTGYGANQLLGAPNVTRQGDDSRAWCPATMSSKDWLLLDFDAVIKSTGLEIYESYNPGSVAKISSIDWWGRERVVWEGTTTPPVGNKTTISFDQLTNCKRLKIYLDGAKVGGWNEIDAVGLIDRRSKVHWPSRARSSSSWGNATTDSDKVYVNSGQQVYFGSVGIVR